MFFRQGFNTSFIIEAMKISTKLQKKCVKLLSNEIKALTSRRETKNGVMLEWLKRHAWKACSRQKRLPSSNLGHSAKPWIRQRIHGFFSWCKVLSWDVFLCLLVLEWRKIIVCFFYIDYIFIY